LRESVRVRSFQTSEIDLMLSYSQDFGDLQSAFSAVRLMIGHEDIQGSHNWETVLKIPGQRVAACDSAKEALEIVRSELAALDAGGVLDGEWVLSIPPTDKEGFPIDLLRNGKLKNFRCLFGILEQELETLNDALVWVRLALSNSYQLRITSVRDQPRLWRLEPVDAAVGGAVLEMGYGLPFFWRGRTRTHVRRNTLPFDSKPVANVAD
jgi:hypothetical protein